MLVELNIILTAVFGIAETGAVYVLKRDVAISAGDCTSTSCKNWGVCITAPGGHSCFCKAGWAGADCTSDGGNPLDTSALFTDNSITIWGDFQNIDQCQRGYFFTGFQYKITGEQGGGDDTAINKLKMICSPPDGGSYNRHSVEQGIDWDDWSDEVNCPQDYYMVAFNKMVDPDSGGCCDDWGVAAYNFTCRGPGLLGTAETTIQSNIGAGDWGNWGSSNSRTCPVGSAMCGFKTRVVGYQGWAAWQDDASIVDTNFYCCHFAKRPVKYVIQNLSYKFDSEKLFNKTTPLVVDSETVENKMAQEITATGTLSADFTKEDSLEETAGLTRTVSVEVSVGSEALSLSASVGFSVSGSYSTTWGSSIVDKSSVTFSVQVKVPAGASGELKLVLHQAKTDVPYTANLVTYFDDGSTDTRQIAGTWKAIRAVKFQVTIPSTFTLAS